MFYEKSQKYRKYQKAVKKKVYIRFATGGNLDYLYTHETSLDSENAAINIPVNASLRERWPAGTDPKEMK